MYEQFKNQFVTSLSEHFPEQEINFIIAHLSMTAADYDITKKETSVMVYSSELPQLVKTYLVCKKLEGLSEQTLYNYGRYLKIFYIPSQ